MSRSTTAVVTATVRNQLQQVLASSPRSRLLNELADAPLQAASVDLSLREAPPEVGRFAGRAGALAAEPGWEAAVRAAAPAPLTAVKDLLGQCESELAQGNFDDAAALARYGDARLRNALRETACDLAASERTGAASIVERALTSIGCRTIVRETDGATGIEAGRGNQQMVVLVKDGGVMTMESAGCGEDTCEPFHREATQAIEAQGGALEEVKATVHGDFRGGALIREAARVANGDSLADGAVRYAKMRRRARFSREAEAPTARSERIAQSH
jgi:hypothetical protein